MSDNELLQAMWDAFTVGDEGDDGEWDREKWERQKLASGRAVLDVLHANGYRRCAEGQRTTQWCQMAEDANAAQRAAENDLSKYMARAAMAEAEVERLRAELRQMTDLSLLNRYEDYEIRSVVAECAHAAIDAARGEQA